ncbi:hypothetical protein IW261DRAFT_1509979 [Armillaria novae-zelandiae]|uniref:BZIP domain-containing protein n=1 Tax=Armillaria novae-zelandiae TaxID=153914 RepID=A0AA39NUM6_9AGAR|nr:hypothetical protein IW261DRAFT_1509979 [Armillaria novae-zelandiae]
MSSKISKTVTSQSSATQGSSSLVSGVHPDFTCKLSQCSVENGPIALGSYEPDDTLKIKTVCSDATASGFVFVPASPLPTEKETGQEAVGQSNNIHDMLGQMMKAGNDTTIAILQNDNATLMERIQALESANAALKQENEDLSQENKALVEKLESYTCH